MSNAHSTHSAPCSTAEATPGQLRHAEGTLDAWTAVPWAEGLQIDQLDVLEPLTVRTRNSTYTIVVVRPATGEVLMHGGRIGPAFEHGIVVGATAGGSAIKLRGIYPGLRMEIVLSGRRLLTSVVESIATARPS